jgi:hypothetical protein
VQYTLCAVLPSGLPGGPIVLEGFVGTLFRSEPGLALEQEDKINQQMVLLPRLELGSLG